MAHEEGMNFEKRFSTSELKAVWMIISRLNRNANQVSDELTKIPDTSTPLLAGVLKKTHSPGSPTPNSEVKNAWSYTSTRLLFLYYVYLEVN
jgi:hypothetical protein